MLYPSALVNLELNHKRTFAQLHEEEDGWRYLYRERGSVYFVAVVNRCISPYSPDFNTLICKNENSMKCM